MIGAYLSHHPLDNALDRLTRLGVKPLAEIDADSDGQTVTVGGLLAGVRAFITRKGDQMATAGLDDLDGSIDLILYPRIYRRAQEHVRDDNVVVVTGTISVAEGRPELRVESLLPLDSRELDDRLLQLEADDDQADSDPVLPEPIPFPTAGTREAPVGIEGPTRLVINFHRTDDRQRDLQQIAALYNSILRHPGRDRVILVVHGNGRPKPLQLPIDTARLGAELKAQDCRPSLPRPDCG